MIIALSVLIASGSMQSVRVDGPGLFRLTDGRTMSYAASVRLTRVQGVLGVEGGLTLAPTIAIPATTERIQVDLDGTVNVLSQGSYRKVGRIVLELFPSGVTMRSVGGFQQTSARGRLANPGEGTAGVIRMIQAEPRLERPAEPARETRTTIRVRPHSEVFGDRILLGQIAEIEGPFAARLAAIDLGSAPLFGTERGIGQTFLSGRLAVHGFEARQLEIVSPAQAMVRRAAQQVSAQDLVQAAQIAVQERTGVRVAPPASDVRPMSAPVGEVRLETAVGARSATGIAVTVTVFVGERRIGSRTMTLVPEAGAEQVKSGDTVRIRFVRGKIVVEMTGQARRAGWVGERVSVATAAGATYTGILRAGGVVEVTL
jgi:hypothetical protein